MGRRDLLASLVSEENGKDIAYFDIGNSVFDS